MQIKRSTVRSFLHFSNLLERWLSGRQWLLNSNQEVKSVSVMLQNVTGVIGNRDHWKGRYKRMLTEFSPMPQSTWAMAAKPTLSSTVRASKLLYLKDLYGKVALNLLWAHWIVSAGMYLQGSTAWLRVADPGVCHWLWLQWKQLREQCIEAPSQEIHGGLCGK
jgi:hypothetical protein